MKSLNHDFYDSMINMKSTKQKITAITAITPIKKITVQTKGIIA
jgi:hypothetical protein